MKRLMLSVLFLAAAFSFVKAQGVSGGFKAGINLANQSVSGSGVSVSAESITSFHGGFFVKAMFSEKVGFQPELLYSIQGSSFGSAKDTYSYLNLPLLLRVQIIPAINIHAGPQVGFCLSAKSDSGSGSSTTVTDSVNPIDLGLGIGAGFDVGQFNGGIRYNLGLSNIAKDAPSGYSLKNNVFQIYIGVTVFGAGD